MANPSKDVELDRFSGHADKRDVAEQTVPVAYESDSDVSQVTARKYDPAYDKRDMKRLGKRQETKRRFRFFTIAGYVVVLGLTWEFILTTSIFGLTNGGTAGSIWMTVAVCFGMFTVVLSMAEMASMAPTAGGQYHWTSEFAPPQYQKQLSYTVGWLCALGWQPCIPSVAYVGAQQVIALIAVCNENYVYHRWHAALITIAFTIISIVFNTVFIGKLPLLERIAVTLHVIGFFILVIIFWVMGPHTNPQEVFFHFEDAEGWGSVGLATLVGMIGPVITFIGGDSAVHLAEELQDASYVLPRAMISAALTNYVLGFVMCVSFMSNLGNVQKLLISSTGQPWVQLIYNITGSKGATIVLVIIMIILYFFCCVNQVTTTSRQLWSFARDKGVPFHQFLSEVRPQSGVPRNAVFVTFIVGCICALIIIGSPLAFNIILSISATGLMGSYMIVVGVILRKRVVGEPFLPSKFRLGRFGIPINAFALGFSALAFFFAMWPAAPNPTPATMNWSVLVFGVIVILALGYYFIRGYREYDGPVEYIRRDIQ